MKKRERQMRLAQDKVIRGLKTTFKLKKILLLNAKNNYYGVKREIKVISFRYVFNYAIKHDMIKSSIIRTEFIDMISY